jgi:hypothetical protein
MAPATIPRPTGANGISRYRNGVSVTRTPQGFTVFINGEEHYTYDDPEKAHKEAEYLESALDDEVHE